MLQQTINNLIHDFSLVQLYVKNNQQAGFSDMTRLLESLSIQMFKATHNLDLKNKNFLFPNFPAIDLADDAQRTAVQVTTNADSKKIKHTLKMFNEHKLSRDYDTLIILGFIECSRSKALPTFCTVLNINDLISLVTDRNDDDLAQDLVDALQQHSDFSRVHPYDDNNCLEIVLRCIDRSAIKHRMACEGSYADMIKGLNEITELISKGTIGRKQKGKSIDSFSDPKIQAFLTAVRNAISQIVAIVNQCRDASSGLVAIDADQLGEIGRHKSYIIEKANEMAQQIGSDLRMQVI
ncbi:SMEK domain-containing protein [uncultured Thiodictyon sp.]|uniref:SMEK domain-containing protein n=1 Tax=uncultured Thiodictyon sp. TaxID=1846217 RepID=UPI0025D073D0|nr:SMEK domain-containing protein [uncultured Thiodictyon sp.]